MRKLWQYQWLIVLFLLLMATGTGAQVNCPPNIGFESGNFDHWQTYVGRIYPDGKLTLGVSAPKQLRHKIIKNTNQGEVDFYGNFPVTSPNGSGYSIRLGNDSSEAQTESVSYTFQIPANKNDYSLLYHYAVVLQNPEHQEFQQPRFVSRIFNVTDNKYVDCATFQFVASGDLPDFFLSKNGQEVYYKDWSPITLNLFGYAGKTLRLEFTTNDCAAGAHFGYAYVDVNENCSTPLSGNVVCVNKDVVTLTAPYGFKEYNWYSNDFLQRLGSENVLKVFPAIPGTRYAVEIIPYPGLGCQDTLRTIIQLSADPFHFQVLDSVVGCEVPGIDLTSSLLTTGSGAGMFYSYFSDSNTKKAVPFPKAAQKGTYYIKAENTAGCSDIKPIKALARPVSLVITDPPAACSPDIVNITSSAITSGSEPGLLFSYWKDAITGVSVPSPHAIAEKGMYFIKATNALGCYAIKEVNVNIGPRPVFTVEDPPAVMYPTKVNLRQWIHSGEGTNFSFWKNPLTTQRFAHPEAVDSSGVYYIKGTTNAGCSVVLPVRVTINPPVNVPNAFSPNNDGINDIWSIPALQLYPNCIIEVFDRYGRSLFRSTGYRTEWDGKDQYGKSLPQGTYYYVIKLSAAIPPVGGSIALLK